MSDEPTTRVANGTPAEGQMDDHDLAALARQRRRVRRARTAGIVWAIGTVVFTALFVQHEWSANGAFKHIGNTGNPGDWNPTLWAVGVGALSMIAGITVLKAMLERPAGPAEIARQVERLTATQIGRRMQEKDLWGFARTRLERIRRLRFHIAAWVFGMAILTPVWLFIEWQDNGQFERWSSDSQPGSWDPWILPTGGIWLLVIAAYALRVKLARPPVHGETPPTDGALRTRT